MANEVGTASGLEDLFSKIVTFLTTDATLVGLSQEWAVQRQHRDNIAALTSNLTTASSYRTPIQTCRYDARSLNTDSIAATTSSFFASNYSSGVSYVSWQLASTREVTKVRLQAPVYTGNVQYAPSNFKLQYSDDGSSWTTALTVSSNPVYSTGEAKIFAVSSPGSHVYWRFIIDSVQGSSTTQVAWQTLLLLEADDTVANHFGSEVIFKAPGNTASDEIFTGIRSEYDAGAGWYNLFVNGYTGYNSSEMSWFEQPGSLPGYGAPYALHVPMVPCWNSTMPYWFVASGRSFRFAVKISTSYEGGYLGFILPYATPGQYPYPLAVGGSLVPYPSNRTTYWRYSIADSRHGVYPGPGCDSFGSTEGKNSSLYLRDPSGSWGYFGNRGSPGLLPDGIYGPTQSLIAPYAPTNAWRSVWPHCMNDQWSFGNLPYRECLGGGYVIQPCVLLQRGPTPIVFGELEGTYVISGYDNAAENTATYSGDTVVVFQQAYRNTVHEFWALSLN